MGAKEISLALTRLENALQRHPDRGLHDDPPAIAQWQGDVRMTVLHPSGQEVATDMPTAVGGGGDAVSPGWLFRAGLASCAATCVVLAASRAGVTLQSLKVEAGSRSDARGMLGMTDEHGRAISPAPLSIHLLVEIQADGVPDERIRQLVAQGIAASPVPCAVQQGIAIDLQISGSPG